LAKKARLILLILKGVSWLWPVPSQLKPAVIRDDGRGVKVNLASIYMEFLNQE